MRIYLAVIFGTLGVVIRALLLFGGVYGVGLSPAVLAEVQAKYPLSVAMPFKLKYNAEYKLQRIEDLNPDIVLIGSSRGGVVSAASFAPHVFYNFSFTAWTTEQLLREFDRLTQVSHPRLVILTMDYFMFSDRWERAYGANRSMVYGDRWQYFRDSTGNLFKALLRDRRLIANVEPQRFVGVQAVVRQEGFRNDGSFYFSPEHVAWSAATSLTSDFFLNSFDGAPKMSPRQKSFVVQLAALAQARHVGLAAIQFPILGIAVDRLDNDPSRREYTGIWREFESQANRDWFASLGIHLFDEARDDLNSNPAYFIDAAHLSSEGAAKLLDKLRQEPDFASLLGRRLTAR